MQPNLTDILCTSCGLCCDGSLFADVELGRGDEASSLEALGLEIEDAGDGHRGLLLQPCRALKGTRCSVYEHRPKCCRTFECRLLQETRRGLVQVEAATAVIADALGRAAHVRELAAALGIADPGLPLMERGTEALALSEELDADGATHARRADLEASLDALERLLRERFLDG